MNKLKWLAPVAIVFLLVASIIGFNHSPASLGEIFDPSGNPFANRFSDVTDFRAATFIVAASDSEHRSEADYRCDGTADQVQINSALTALPATGGVVVLLEGTYTTAASIVLTSYDTLRGSGVGTIITTSTADLDIITATGQSQVAIRDLQIDGNLGGVTCDAGVYFNNADESKVKDCYIRDCGESGVYLFQGSDNNEVVGNTFNACQYGVRANLSLKNIISRNTVLAATVGGVSLTNGSHETTVIGNYISGSTAEGISISGSDECKLNNNTVIDNGANGIKILQCENCSIDGNIITGHVSPDDGILMVTCYYCTITGNTISGNGLGIRIEDSSYRCIVSSNIFQGNSSGIDFGASEYCSVIGNTVIGGTGSAIKVLSSDYANVVGNLVEGSSAEGIYIYRSSRCNIEANTCHNNGEGIFLRGDATDNASYNFVHGNILKDNTYGIDISDARADNNRIIDNEVTGGTPIYDAGTNTKWNSIIIPFSDGTDPQDSGYEIDVDTEYASAWFKLPAEVQYVLKIKVYARSVVADAEEMELQMVIYGGADNEPYNTHDGSIVQLDSSSVGFAADDIIFWVNTETGTLALTGGDCVEVKVLHEAVEGDNCATDAFFRVIEIEYQ